MIPDHQFEELRELMRQLAKRIEDAWIEKETLSNHLRDNFSVTQDQIQALTSQALENPEMRKIAHQHFSVLWSGIEDKSFEIAAKELLKLPTKTDKPM
jgi:hypothetical protein